MGWYWNWVTHIGLVIVFKQLLVSRFTVLNICLLIFVWFCDFPPKLDFLKCVVKIIMFLLILFIKLVFLCNSVVEGLKKIYKSKILPLEQTYFFHDFHSPELSDPDFDARPMILLVGQYSTGKTTFIRYLLEKDFPGTKCGCEAAVCILLIKYPLL